MKNLGIALGLMLVAVAAYAANCCGIGLDCCKVQAPCCDDAKK